MTDAIWPLRPNWRETYRISYAFKTEIIVSEAGREQRRMLRQTPRKTITFQVTADGDRFRALVRTMAKQHGELIWLPEVTRQARLTADSGVGANTVTLDAVPSWLPPVDQVLLVNGDTAELRTVAGVSGSVVTFSEHNTTDWPAGSRVCWALHGRINPSQNYSQPATGIVDGQVVFVVEPAFEDEQTPPAAPVTWNGREVFLLPANWSSARDLGFARDVEQIDYGFGPVETFLPVPFTSETRAVTFLGMSVADVQALLDFFLRCGGALGEFYAPSGDPEIIISLPASTGALTLFVAGTDFADAYGGDVVRKAISVVMNDGRRFYAGVSDVTVQAGASKIQILDALPYDISPATVRTISWMPVCRLATDELTLEWLTDEVAQCQLTFQALEALPAETLT